MGPEFGQVFFSSAASRHIQPLLKGRDLGSTFWRVKDQSICGQMLKPQQWLPDSVFRSQVHLPLTELFFFGFVLLVSLHVFIALLLIKAQRGQPSIRPPRRVWV